MEDLGEFEMNALDSYDVPNDGSYPTGYEETDFGGTDRDPTVSVDTERGAVRFKKPGETRIDPYQDFDENRPDIISGRNTDTTPTYVEMGEFNNNRVADNSMRDTEETDFGGTEDDNSHVTGGLYLGRTVRQPRLHRIAISRAAVKRMIRETVYIHTEDFFTNILGLEPECNDTRFVDHMLDNGFKIDRVSHISDDYIVRYLGNNYRSVGRTLVDKDFNTLKDGVRHDYDEWQRKMLRSAVKRAGVLAGIGLSIAAVVTGLAVGLTRKGSDVIHAGKNRREWEKLNPAKVSIPWSDIEEAGGGALVFTVKYLTVILAISAAYLTVRRRGTSK